MNKRKPKRRGKKKNKQSNIYWCFKTPLEKSLKGGNKK